MDQSIFSLFTTKDWPFQFPSTQKNDSQNNSLRSRQGTIDGLLFFDRLMQLASISNFKDLYPPPHPSRLRQLLDSIDACAFDLLKRNCLVYYLLKEYGDRREIRFANNRLIPSHFTRGLDGLWALDHSDWKTAVRCLIDPTVTPDFIPEIIGTLATQPPVKLRSEYVMRFYQLTQLSLELRSIELVLRAMCTNCHIRSAWNLQRSYGRPERDRLLRIIFETCFGLNDFCQPLSNSLKLLITFPYDELEDSLLSHFALEAPKLLPESHSMVVINFYLTKLTAEARYMEAIRYERALSESTQLGSNPDIDRIIRGIAQLLPEIERNYLELEFDQQHPILNEKQTLSGRAQNDSNEMDMSATYDVCSLAWDPPPSPPVLPPPSSLAEARSQQEILNPPKPIISRTSLPLSASPILRRAMPRMSLDKSNVPQKVLLKALAYTRQPSAPNSPDLNQAPRHQIDQKDDQHDDATMTSPRASSRPTPRFQHFVGPSSRLPPSATKPPPQPNFSTSFARSTVTATGSPFHRLSFPDSKESDKPSPKSGEERWPTRIVFTPRRPPSQSQKKPEERSIIPRQPINRISNTAAQHIDNNRTEQARGSKQIDSSSSGSSSNDENDESEEEHIVSNQKSSLAKQFTAVVVPTRDQNRQHGQVKSPPKKIARVNNNFKENATPRKMDKILPGGLHSDDEDMEPPPPAAPLRTTSNEEKQRNNENSKSSNTYRSSNNSRKKVKINNQNNNNVTNQVAPITPRRSTRLHSSNTTPVASKLNKKAFVLPGAIGDHDLIEEDDEVSNNNDHQNEKVEKNSSSQVSIKKNSSANNPQHKTKKKNGRT